MHVRTGLGGKIDPQAISTELSSQVGWGVKYDLSGGRLFLFHFFLFPS